MADIAPLARQWRLLHTLSARRSGTTVREFSDELGVVDKTIRRDLLFLAKTGFPLIESVGEYGRKSWKLDFPSGVPPLSFTLTEVAALHVGRELMLPLAGTDFGSGAHSAFRKIRSALGDAAVKYLAKLAAIFHATSFGASDYSNHTAIIDQLMIACEDSKVAFVTYQSQRATEPVTVEVYPYGIVHHKGALYLVAFAREHNEVRHYKVNRISTVGIHAQQIPIQRPADFDLKRHLTDSFGIMRGDGVTQRVRIRFTREVARIVSEKTWHPSQKLTDQPDGSLIAEFLLDDLREVTSWVLSFGAQAWALAPKEFVQEVANELQRAAALYAEPATSHPKEPARQRKAPK